MRKYLASLLIALSIFGCVPTQQAQPAHSAELLIMAKDCPSSEAYSKGDIVSVAPDGFYDQSTGYTFANGFIVVKLLGISEETVKKFEEQLNGIKDEQFSGTVVFVNPSIWNQNLHGVSVQGISIPSEIVPVNSSDEAIKGEILSKISGQFQNMTNIVIGSKGSAVIAKDENNNDVVAPTVEASFSYQTPYIKRLRKRQLPQAYITALILTGKSRSKVNDTVIQGFLNNIVEKTQ